MNNAVQLDLFENAKVLRDFRLIHRRNMNNTPCRFSSHILSCKHQGMQYEYSIEYNELGNVADEVLTLDGFRQPNEEI